MPFISFAEIDIEFRAMNRYSSPMPIKIVYEKRYDKGEPDISYPAVFCDACGKRIHNSAGNYYWQCPFRKDRDEDECYNSQMDVVFLHCDCDARITGHLQHNGGQPFMLKTPFGLFHSDSVTHNSRGLVGWQPLEYFPLYLGRNIGMSINAEGVRYRRDTLGFDTTPRMYSPGDDWIYFVVDNGSIERKVKIGFSTDVHARIRNMQTGSPTLLKCYGAFRGPQSDEQLAHQLLEDYRSHGEWFIFDKVQDTIDDWIEAERIFRTRY